MVRSTAKWSFRLGFLLAIGFLVKKLLESQQEQPAPVVPTPQPKSRPAPPTPAPSPPAGATPPAPVEAPAPVETPVAPAPAAAQRRTEPLKAKRIADRMERPVRANRNVAGDGAPKTPKAAMVSWVEPLDGVCPTTHPIKAKLGSKVFRKPGMASYDASKPDRCYASEGAARRAGFNEAQR